MTSSFLHAPIAWAALFLVSIPIIIHLINRRRFLRIDWAAMEFLLDALKKNRRRLRIEQLVLLLLRIVMVALAGFLLARPIVSDRGLAWIASAFRSEDKIFILDDSFSMSRRDAGRTAFERAVDALGGQVRRSDGRGGSDRLTILRGSRYRNPIIRGRSLDEEQAIGVVETLSRLAPGDSRLPVTRVLDAVAALESAGEGSAAAGGGVPRPRVIAVLTDLRATDWTSPQGGPDEAVHQALLRLAGNESVPTRLIVLDVGTEETANTAIVSVALEGGRAVQGIPADLRVEVRNFGTLPATGLGLRVRYAPAPALSSDDAGFSTTLGPPVDDLAPRESRVYTVPCTFRTAGHYGVLVELTGAQDALPGDNVFPMAVDVVTGTDVLIVSGEPSSERFEGEADFLAEALAPEGDVASGIRPLVVVEENLPRSGLEGYAAVFALNLNSFPREFLSPLARYVREGGTFVVFPGDQVDAGLYNRDLGPGGTVAASPDGIVPDASDDGASGASEAGGPSDADGDPSGAGGAPARSHGLLPARLGPVAGTAESPLGIRFATDHPYFRLLRGAEDLVAMVRFDRFFQLEPLSGAQILARFTDAEGTPAIVEHAVDRGLVILFASSADLEWNDWARNPTYLMVLQELVANVLRARSERSVPLAGAPLHVPIDIAGYGQEGRLRGPSYPATPEKVLIASPATAEGDGAASSTAFRFVIEDSHQTGLYAIQLREKSGATEWRQLAVTRDPRESDLERVSAARLRELYPDVDLTVLRDPAAFSDVGRGGFEASDLLLWTFLGLLFLETLLARIFAHHPGAGRGAERGGGA